MAGFMAGFMHNLGSHFLSWLHWNPDRVLFTIPIVDRPVVWYGVWFVFGFLIGYFVLLPIFESMLRSKRSSSIAASDISNWHELIEQLKHPPTELNTICNKALRKQLDRYKPQQNKSNQTIDPVFQEALLSSLNEAQTTKHLSREELQRLLPNCIKSFHELAQFLVDRLTWFVIAGAIIGARVGHILFYDWYRYQHNFIEIFQIWKGGLASHGGAIGVLLAIYLFERSIRSSFPEFSFLSVLDKVVIPTGFVGSCIRIGNFFNQEILGTPTSAPWGVIFGDPADGTLPLVRHPVQLYESVVYLALFVFLLKLWEKHKESLKEGYLTGIFFIGLFGARFFLEFFKMPQSSMFNEPWLQTGQYLSLPFILGGIYLLYRMREESVPKAELL